MEIRNNNLLITGGASGIGRLISRMALEKGAKSVSIWDINQENIDKVVAEFSPLGTIRGYRVDVSKSDEVMAAYTQTRQDAGSVDIVIQCAGIVTSNKTFDQNSISEIDRTMMINTIAPMYVGHAVLSDMIERDKGHIVNIASAAGTLSLPKMSIYTASKWGVLGWSDSVRIELQKRKSNVKVTSVCPYFINTGMFDGVQSRIFPILDPEKTARRIVKSLEKDKRFVGIPFGFHFTRLMQGLIPVKLFDWIFGEVFGVYHVMDHFTGRK